GCATMEEIGRAAGAGAVAAIPKVDSPFLRSAGVNLYPNAISITNTTPYWGKVMVYGEKVGEIAPGDTIYDNRHWEPLWPEIPVAVMFYTSAEQTTYLGVSVAIFQYNRSSWGGGDTYSWIIDPGDIIPFASQRLPLPEEAPRTEARTTRVRFPREPFNGTTAVQVINNTRWTAHIRANGREIAVATPGEFLYLRNHLRWYGSWYGSDEILLQFIFVDEEKKLVGAEDYRVYVQQNYIRAEQIVLTEDMVR
ncbi:hypothetical protein D6779_05970, partial [Candidatus Parcubacteria bacterium]